jgi:ribonuclease-3
MFDELQQKLDYYFSDQSLLIKALTHSSFANETPLEDNETLEFLGDAVLGLFIAESLMRISRDSSEGRLSRWRSNLVSQETLAIIARNLYLQEELMVSESARKSLESDSVLSSTFEALIAAIYLDSGSYSVQKVLSKIYRSHFDSFAKGEEEILEEQDKKSPLQSLTQSRFKINPTYELVDTWGPAHELNFEVTVFLGKEWIASATGKSRKDAEQQAAGLALNVLRSRPDLLLNHLGK